VAYQYDNDGLMTAAGALTMTQNSANGLLTGTTLGSVTTSQTYDAFGGLASYTASYSGNTLFQTTYTRDAVGRITRLIETIQGATDTLDYAYDLVGRLTSVDRNGVIVESYTYDANGNRTSFAGPSGTVNATYDDQDRLLTYGNATFSYTAAGELTRKVVGADTTDYTYDEMGNLVGVALQAGTDVEYLIDGQDRRVGRKVGGQILDGLLYGDQLNPVARLDSLGNPAAHFVYGSRPNVPDYMVQAGTTYRLITDHLGSVRLIVNAGTGQVAQRLDYTSFGTVMQDTHPGLQPFGYAGGLSDPTTALVRFGLRDLDTEVGRWTSSDPIGFAGGGTNLYEYVRNSPIQYVDPTGLCSTPDCWDEFLDLTISAAFDLIGARLIGFFARVGRSRILAQSVGQRSVWAAEARNAGDVINANVYDQIADLIGRISREEIELAAQDAIVSSTLKTYEIGAADWANDPFWQNILNLVPYLGTGMKLGDFLRCLGFGLIL
jgi:RHS repeat-associated protein